MLVADYSNGQANICRIRLRSVITEKFRYSNILKMSLFILLKLRATISTNTCPSSNILHSVNTDPLR